MANLNHKHTEGLFVGLIASLYRVLFVLPFSIINVLLQLFIVVPWFIISTFVVFFENIFLIIITMLLSVFCFFGVVLGFPIGVATVLFIESETQLGLSLIGISFGCCLVFAFSSYYGYDDVESLIIPLNILFIGLGLFTFVLGTGSYFLVGGLILLGILGLSGELEWDDAFWRWLDSQWGL